MKFKPGSRVICIDDKDSGHKLEEGKKYTIKEEFINNNIRGCIKLEELTGIYFETRFISLCRKEKLNRILF
jgi:hypothetical protein